MALIKRIRTIKGKGITPFLLFLLIITSPVLLAQTRTVTTAGNWDNTGIWTGGLIADVIGEDASFNGNLGGTGIVTVPSPQNYTIGNLAMNAGNDLVIANGATLNIGDISNIRNLTTGNNCSITVSGTLIIWGDLDPGGNFSINVTSTGVLIVKDDFEPGNDSDFTSSGTVDIDGDFVMGGNADITISGPLDVGGNFDFGNDADIILNSPGDLNVSGNFDGGGNADITIDNGSSIGVGGFFDVGNDADLILNGGLDVTGDFTGGGNLDITVGSTGDLFIGDDISFGNDADIIVDGGMDVIGDFTGGGNTDITVNSGGDLNVGEDVVINNDGDIVVDGSFDIGGDFTGGSNTDFDVDGIVTIGDDISVGNNSDAIGSGSILIGGDCADGTSNFCGQGPLGVLPIELAYFTATINDNEDVSILWATEKEEGFDHFEIERAGSNLNFSTIAEVPGAGYNTTTYQEYSWLDENPLVGHNYYRLKAVDLDGSYEYFNVVFITTTGKRDFSVFPNPSNGRDLKYRVNFDFTSGDRIILLNSMGIEIQNFLVSSVEDYLNFSEPLKPGVYFVKYSSTGFEQTFRLIIR